MKIAMMVRGYVPVPRPTDMIYAPIDLEVAIAKGLAARGHDVDVYAPLGSKIRARGVKVITLNIRPLVHNQDEFKRLLGQTELMTHYVPGNWDRFMANEMFVAAKHRRYDLLHFHHPEVALTSAPLFPRVPVAYTLHDPIYRWYCDLFEMFASPNQHFISISKNQRRDAPDLPYAGTVHNGIDLDKFRFSAKHEDYLLYAGRIVPEKGVKEAIHVAKQTGHRLLIIGPTYPDSQEYFDQFIKPKLNDKILYLGYIEQENLPKYYQKAKAVLTPVQWEEPFGLTTVEAMACGTPVISLRRGAAPEIIVDGQTGFVCDSLAEMAEAVGRVDMLDRRVCRRHVEEHFAIDQMVDGYEAAFREILRGRRLNLVKSKLREVKHSRVAEQGKRGLAKGRKLIK